MAVFSFIGFGELGSSLAEGLSGSGRHTLRAFTREPSSPEAADTLEERLSRSGTALYGSLEDTLSEAGAVLSVVPAGESLATAERCAPLLGAETYYVDLAAAPVAQKREGAGLVGRAGAKYVDGAVLGTVATSGFSVPILVSGPGANGFKALVDDEDLSIEVLDAPAGDATLVKLLRSVYMKGRDALVLETMLAARRYGLEARVAESIAGPGEEVSFTALADRVLRALAVHAGRRADELLASADVVRAASVDPVMTLAGADVLHDMAALGLREKFARKRPASGEETLSAIEAAVPRPAPGGPAASHPDRG